MNDLQIDYFIAVARNLSFTKTAEEMYVSQPAISRQISHLEEELGYPLFDRSKKTTQLTPAGGLFYDFFVKYKQELIYAKDRASKLAHEQVGSIRLACLDGWNGVEAVPEALSNFHENFKNVDVTLSSYGFKGLLKALGSDKVDIILTLDGMLEDYGDIMIKKIYSLPKKIIYSKHHRLAGYANMAPKDFREEKFFVPCADESTDAESKVKSYMHAYGVEPKLVKVDNIESMLINVQNGLGVAVVDDWTLKSAGGELMSVELGMMDDVVLAWKETNLNPAIGVLVSEMIFILGKQ